MKRKIRYQVTSILFKGSIGIQEAPSSNHLRDKIQASHHFCINSVDLLQPLVNKVPIKMETSHSSKHRGNTQRQQQNCRISRRLRLLLLLTTPERSEEEATEKGGMQVKEGTSRSSGGQHSPPITAETDTKKTTPISTLLVTNERDTLQDGHDTRRGQK